MYLMQHTQKNHQITYHSFIDLQLWYFGEGVTEMTILA
jgi:hypothetical protein